MKAFVLFIILIVLWGCSPSRESLDYTPPVLLSQTSLPEFPPLHPTIKKLTVALYIDSTGSVQKVHFIKGNVNARWDSLAALRIREWKFSPARRNGTPIALWYRYQLDIHYLEPKYLTLAEIVCTSKELADSLYVLLTTQNNFGELARKFSVAESRTNGGFLGTVNIYDYPKPVWMVLEKLQPGEIAPPIQRGAHYIIFKRLSPQPL